MYSRKEIEAAGLDDFRVFLIQVWAYLGLPAPTPVQLDIAYWLQHGPKRAILQAFRGVGKSWITVAFVLWHLFLDPQKKILVVSANQSLADDFSKFCKQLISGMPLLQHLAPRLDQSNSAIKFDVGPALPSKDPSVKSAGITGQITGSRADIIVADDIEVPKNSYTHLLRQRLAELVKEFDAVLKPEAASRVVYLGTPQVEATLYSVLQTRGYVTRIWPAEIPEHPQRYLGKLAPYVTKLMDVGARAGDPVDPLRFGVETLEGKRASYGRSGYSLQFMLDVTLSEADKYPLKCGDCLVYDCDRDVGPAKLVWASERDLTMQDVPCTGLEGDTWRRPSWQEKEMVRWQGTVMAVDPSGRGKDETGYAIVRCNNSTLYLIESGGFKDGFETHVLESLAMAAQRHGVDTYIDERNYGGGMFTKLITPHLTHRSPCRINPEDEWDGWSTGNKENRICDILEPLMQSHRLVLDRRVIERDADVYAETPQYSLIYQMTRIARIKGALPHDDRLEAVAMACSYFTAKMDRDQDRTLKVRRDQILDKDLKEFMRHVVTFPGREKRTSLSFVRR